MPLIKASRSTVYDRKRSSNENPTEEANVAGRGALPASRKIVAVIRNGFSRMDNKLSIDYAAYAQKKIARSPGFV
jgi:hypothetical protein